MAIIGYGTMGREYARLFAKDFDVWAVSSRDVSETAKRDGAKGTLDLGPAVARSKYVAITVPLARIPQVVQRLNAHVDSSALAFDACSAKAPAMKELESLKCSYFGTHLLGEGRIAVCGVPNRVVMASMKRSGLQIERMSPEEHDRRNAVVGMAQFISLTLANYLSARDRGILQGSRLGSALLSSVDHMVSNAPSTYRETQIDNPFTRAQRVRLLSALSSYHKHLNRGEFMFPAQHRNKS